MEDVNGGEAKSDRMGCTRGRGSDGFKYIHVRLGFVVSKQPSINVKSGFAAEHSHYDYNLFDKIKDIHTIV